MHLLALLAIPVLVGLVAGWRSRRWISRWELAAQVVGVGLLMWAGYEFTRWAGVQDYEVWNGRVASKDSGTQGCCHSYDCNCRTVCTTDSQGQSDCDEVCDTCYEHDYDDWYSATSTNAEPIYHDGCNPPGTPTPSAWSAISVGDPTAWEHRFTNYVLADPDALFPKDASYERLVAQLPDYPRPRGWRAQRFVSAGVDLPHPSHWNEGLDGVNADLGAIHQVNVIVVVTDDPDPAWFDALRVHWLGGKKNDVVVVLGAPEAPKIAWARVMAWNLAIGPEDEFTGALAWQLERVGELRPDAVIGSIRAEIERTWRRRPFAELAYLMARARPSKWAMLALSIAGLGISVGLHVWFERRRRRW